MNATLLIDLFGHKRCADAELAEALASVDASAHPEALRAATRTLNHIHVVDEIFRAHLSSRPHGYTATNTADTPVSPRIPGTRDHCTSPATASHPVSGYSAPPRMW